MLERYLEAVAELEERFAGPTQRRDLWVAVGLFVVGFGAYSLLAPSGLLSADAAVYLQQIRDTDFSSRPTHVGYYLLGWLWTQLAGDSERALNLMSCAFAGLGLSFVWLHAARLGRSRLAAGFAVAVAAVHALLVANALHAEVYMTEAALLLASLHLWLRGRAVLSGLLLVAAALVTPSAVFVTPAYVVLRPRWRPLGLLVATAGIGVALGLAPLGLHYFEGSRGLLSGASSHLGLLGGIKKEGTELVLGASACLVWIGVGALLALAQSALRPWLLALAVAWVTGFALGERFGDVPVQLPLHLWACALVAVGVTELPARLALERDRRLGRASAWAALGFGAAVPPALVFAFRGELEAAETLPAMVWFGTALALMAASIACAYYQGFSKQGRSKQGRSKQSRSKQSRFTRSSQAQAERAVHLFAVATLAVASLSAVAQGIATHRFVSSYRAAVSVELAQEPLAVGGWSPGVLFEHYRYGEAYTERWVDWRDFDESSFRRLEEALREGREIWLLDGPLPESVAAQLDVAPPEQRGPVTVLRAR